MDFAVELQNFFVNVTIEGSTKKFQLSGGYFWGPLKIELRPDGKWSCITKEIRKTWTVKETVMTEAEGQKLRERPPAKVCVNVSESKESEDWEKVTEELSMRYKIKVTGSIQLETKCVYCSRWSGDEQPIKMELAHAALEVEVCVRLKSGPETEEPKTPPPMEEDYSMMLDAAAVVCALLAFDPGNLRM